MPSNPQSIKKETLFLIRFNKDLRAIIDSVLFKKEFEGNNPKKTFLIYSFGKAYKTHASILILCENGYGQDAAILARSLFELAVTTLYINKDPTNKRVERWFDYDFVRRNKMFNYMKSDSRFIELLKEKDKSIKDNFFSKLENTAQQKQTKHNYNNKGWSDKNIFDMTKEVGLESLYPTVYKLFTEIHHSGVGCVNDYLSLEIDSLAADIGSSYKWIDETLVSSFQFFLIVINEFNNVFNLSLDKEIDEIKKRWIEGVGNKLK